MKETANYLSEFDAAQHAYQWCSELAEHGGLYILDDKHVIIYEKECPRKLARLSRIMKWAVRCTTQDPNQYRMVFAIMFAECALSMAAHLRSKDSASISARMAEFSNEKEGFDALFEAWINGDTTYFERCDNHSE